ncbi:hypothetical protein QZH41_004646 [Actinostola sp. cb2023]|nr:hypothetical protein QZH41_004646 [Actinostola sp. cb2023]
MATPGFEDKEGDVADSEAVGLEGAVSGSFLEQFELLKLQRQVRQDEMEVLREEREARKEEREARKEDEERQLRILSLQLEMKKMEVDAQATQMSVRGVKKVTLLKMRDMRDNEDIDDFFRVFEMTAKTQLIPKEEWLGSLIPRLSERAKAVYLEFKDTDAQNYDLTKLAILESYQLTIDHYRYKFRHSEKLADEDFVQWARRTRRFLDRWMLVAGATGNAERILEQVTIEMMLDSVSSELRAWLKEMKPDTAEQLAKIANEHVQVRKGPMIDGRYVSNDKNRFRRNTFGEQRKNTDVSSPEPKRTERTPPPAKEEEKDSPRPRSSIRCYRCKEPGHLSYNCPTKPTSTKPPGPRAGYLCLTPLNTEPHFTEYYIEGFIGGKQAKMLVDTGCTRTLVHRKFVSKSDETANKITVLTATGRSSYGRVITRQNLLNQWGDCDQAFVVTRNQAKLNEAQERIEELIDHRIVVPESYRQEILRISHAIPLAGHLAKEKTISRLGVTRIKTSVYHPQANGLVERFNGTLKHMLRYSPFELLYGRTVRGPLAVIKETWMETESPQTNLATHVLEMRRRMVTMQQAVSENMQKSQAKQKRQYDKKSSVRKFEVGDKVLVLLPTPGNKLETKWNGPYTVTRAHGDGRTYEIDTGCLILGRLR